MYVIINWSINKWSIIKQNITLVVLWTVDLTRRVVLSTIFSQLISAGHDLSENAKNTCPLISKSTVKIKIKCHITNNIGKMEMLHFFSYKSLKRWLYCTTKNSKLPKSSILNKWKWNIILFRIICPL